MCRESVQTSIALQEQQQLRIGNVKLWLPCVAQRQCDINIIFCLHAATLMYTLQEHVIVVTAQYHSLRLHSHAMHFPLKPIKIKHCASPFLLLDVFSQY